MSDELNKVSREGMSYEGAEGPFWSGNFQEDRPNEGRVNDYRKDFVLPSGEIDSTPSRDWRSVPVKTPINPSLRFDCIKIAAGLPDAYSTADVIRNGNTIYEAVTK